MILRLSNIVGSGYSEFWHTMKRYRILIGGRASKKSTTTALWYITNLMKYPGANVLVIRKVYKDHKDSTYAQLKWAINQLQVRELFECRLSPLEIIYKPTGQKIMFRGLDDPMSITSITVEKGFLCWVWFEEFFQIANEQDFNTIDLSIRGEVPAPLFKQITGTMNPWNEKHWIKRRFFDNKDEDTFTLRTDYTVNEFLGEDDIKLFEQMKIRFPRRYNVEGLGNWGMAEGLVYDTWEELEFDLPELLRLRPHLQPTCGLDFGYTADPTALVAAFVDMKAKEIFTYDEHYQRGMTNDMIADMIRYKNLQKSLITADSAEPKSIAELKKFGIIRVRAARKGPDSIRSGIQFIRQFKEYIHPRCTNTILEKNNYAFETKDGRVTNTPIDDYNHLMDAQRYSMERFIVGAAVRVLGKRAA